MTPGSNAAGPAAQGRSIPRTHKTRRFDARTRRRLRIGLLFVSPWVVGFLAFTLYPFLATLFYSFTNYDIVSDARWVGLANYQNLMHDDLFWTSLWNTAFYTVLEVPLSTVVAIGLAMLLNMKVKGLAIYRTVFYLPTVVPVVASSILWIWLFNPSFGVVNDILTDVHVTGPGWMFSTLWSKPTFVLLGIWGSGAPMVVYLAALQGIPKDMYEVAHLEGANAWQRIRYVMLPMISPAILFNVILALVACMQYFTQAYVMTQGQGLGAPDNSTLFYSIYLYQQAFQELRLGYASAMAWILFVIVLIITLLLFRSSSRWVYYAGKD